MFGKLFGGGKKSSASILTETPECLHAVLVPRWESVQDMGKVDKATRYMCEACHREFTPEEAEKVRQNIGARLIGQDEANRS
jgi:hypothetical protein